jgi:hypothetical protein
METQPLTELINQNKRVLTYYEDSARAKVEQLLAQPLLPAEQNKIYETLGKFIKLNFVHELSKKYPIISNEIFDERKEEKVKVKTNDRYEAEREYTIPLPVVVRISLDRIRAGEDYMFVTKGKRESNNYTEDVRVSCTIPEITPEARIALSEAIVTSAELTAKAYKDNLLSRILIRDRMNEHPAIGGPLGAGYNLIWAPSSWNAEIIEKDPAILMNYAGTNMLVYHWTIPEEKSLDAMLREYSANWFRMDEIEN